MATEDLHVVLLFAFIAVLLGGIGLIGFLFIARHRIKELTIKERIALIEKGLMPSPELDPGRFETMLGLGRQANGKAARYRSAGVMLMGLGAALVVLLAFAGGVPEVAVGVGGGLAILGLAIFVNGYLIASDPPDPPVPPAA